MKQQWLKKECQGKIAVRQGNVREFLVKDFVWTMNYAGLGGSVGCTSNWRPGGRGFDPRRGRQHSFVEIDHEIFSTVILSLPLIQEGQLSVSGKRMCTILVNRLEDKACPVNMWLGKLTALDMTPLGWLGRKTSAQTNKLQLSGAVQFSVLFKR